MNENIQRLMKIICEVLEVDFGSIDLEDEIEQIEEWDSLAHMQIIAEFEDEFGISIPIEEVGKIKKVSEIADYLKEG